MKFYEVYLPKQSEDTPENAIFVHDGFSIGAAILQPFWFLYHKLWIPAAIILALHIALASVEVALGISEEIQFSFNILSALLAGFFASDIRAWALKGQGYDFTAVISGKTLIEAQQRFFDRQVAR
jgi:hypothetical protein